MPKTQYNSREPSCNFSRTSESLPVSIPYRATTALASSSFCMIQPALRSSHAAPSLIQRLTLALASLLHCGAYRGLRKRRHRLRRTSRHRERLAIGSPIRSPAGLHLERQDPHPAPRARRRRLLPARPDPSFPRTFISPPQPPPSPASPSSRSLTEPSTS